MGHLSLNFDRAEFLEVTVILTLSPWSLFFEVKGYSFFLKIHRPHLFEVTFILKLKKSGAYSLKL
jgi:hypothetical protein